MKIRMHTPKILMIITISIVFVIGLIFFILRGQYSNPDLKTLVAKCQDDNPSKQALCLQSTLETLVRENGVDKAFDLIAFLGEIDENEVVNCHDYAHAIGREAYRVFAEGEKFEVSTKTSYCAYGFYHGFMETMLSISGNVSQAKEFCNYIETEFTKKGYSNQLACYHGIGHGWTNVHDETLWGDERAMVYPALELCEQVTQDPHRLSICATGVFDSISIGYYNEAYGLKINKLDPMWLCREQEEKYKDPCYMDLSPAILWLGEYKLDKALTYLHLVEDGHEKPFIESVSSGAVRFVFNRGEDIKDSVNICRTLSLDHSLTCIRGLVGGIIQFGIPDREHEKAIEFCSSEELTSEEQIICSETLVNQLRVKYGKDRFGTVCKMIESELGYACVVE